MICKIIKAKNWKPQAAKEITFPKKVRVSYPNDNTTEEKVVNSQEELDALSSWAGNMCFAYYQSHGLMGMNVSVRTLED